MVDLSMVLPGIKRNRVISPLPPGTAIGTSAEGGTLVVSPTGGTRAIPQTPRSESYRDPSINISNLKLPEREVREVYDPSINAYVSIDSTRRTAQITRSPTSQERQRIREADIRGSLFDRPASEIVRESQIEREKKKKFNELTKNIDTLGNELLRDINRLEKNNIQNGQWVGSEEKLEEFNRKVKQYNEKVQKRLDKIEDVGGTVVAQSTPKGAEYDIYFEGKKINIGVPGTSLKTEVPVSMFTATTGRGAEFQALSSGVSILGRNVDRLSGEFERRKAEAKTDVLGIKGVRRENILEASRLKGEVVSSLGRYSVPVVGIGFFSADIETQLRPYDYNVVGFTKEEPKSAALLGGTLLGVGALKVARKFREPTLRFEGENIAISKKGKDILGLKILEFDKVGGRVTVRPKLERADPIIRVSRRKVGQGQMLESFKTLEPTFIATSKGSAAKISGDILTPKQAGGGTQRVIEGSIVNVQRKGETIYSGIPYGKVGQAQRQRTIRELRKFGIGEGTAKDIIGLKLPKVEAIKSEVSGFFRQGASGESLFLREEATTKGIRQPFSGEFGTIYSRVGGRKRQVREIDLVPSGDDTFIGGITEFTPSRPLGKKTETFQTAIASRRVGEGEIELIARDIGLPGIRIGEPTKFEGYLTGGLTQRIIPRSRRIESGRARVLSLPRRDEEAIVDIDQLLTGGRTQQLQRPTKLKTGRDQELLGAALTTLTTRTSQTQPKVFTDIVSRQTTQPQTRSVWFGTGQYERTTEVAQPLSLTQREAKTIRENVLSVTPLSQNVGNIFSQRTQVSPGQISRLGLGLSTRLDSKTGQRTDQVLGIRARAREKVRGRTRTRLLSRLLQRSVSKQKEKGVGATFSIKGIKTKLPKTPKKDTGDDEDEFLTGFKDKFKVFVRERGEDKPIGEFKGIGQARERLFKTLRTEIRASGFIERAGKKVKIGLGGTEFRRSKVDPFRVVEPKRRRIKRGTLEQTQIKMGGRRNVNILG